MRVDLCAPMPGVRVDHIGSTAIPELRAKDVVGVPPGEVAVVTAALDGGGYVLEGQRETHAWLCTPDADAREAVIHVMEVHGPDWSRRLVFRDELRRGPVVRQAYEALKCALAAEGLDWGAYTARKAAFVAGLVQQADRPVPGSYAMRSFP